ncbi:hypothetical protein E4P40_10705 [Blastococcus sp. CT_GayMR20]|uniref:hypothetical protein n=1 Tax=Blastococcus sp. CT_GayMR20 TaxID=2559609 RepID=UPI001073D982|nr:hypothetical protein [Blastococcus sp. CT_GayMR20]TFV88089.1 hypothetical protein E4P40_10705 [Blastococcus sp. CT_GayMR20]
MTAADGPPAPPALPEDLERAHGYGVDAALAGLQDPALGRLRLTGPGVLQLAEAAVTSATPFLRAPLLGRISAAMLLHPPTGDGEERCPTCRTEAPCPTARTLRS